MDATSREGGAAPGPAGVARLPAWLWSAAAALFVMLCYSPVLFVEYGFGEDYRLLAAAHHGDGPYRQMLAEGRPLFAVWVRVVFSLADTIPALAGVRFLNIAFLAAIGVAMAYVWRRAGMDRMVSAAAGAAVVTLPAFQLFAATAAMGAVLPPTVLAIAAALLVDSCAERPDQPSSTRLGIASLMALAAFVMYQPAGLFFWVVAAVLLVAPNPPAPAFRRKVLFFAGIGSLAMFGALAVFMIGRFAFPTEVLGNVSAQRSLAFDPAGKAVWFLTLPLPHALNLWKLLPNPWLTMAVFTGLVAGMGLHLRGIAAAHRHALLGLALVPLCYLPGFVVAENWSSYRSQMALTTIIFSYCVIVLVSHFRSNRRWIASLVLVAGLMVGGATANRNVVAWIAAPQARELTLVRETVAALPPDVELVGVVPSDPRDALVPVVLYDEFGLPSTAPWWSVYDLTWMALWERSGGSTAAFQVIDARDAAIVPDAVIDWGEVLRSAR